MQSLSCCNVVDLCAIRVLSKQWSDYASVDELWGPLATSRWPSTRMLQEEGHLIRSTFLDVFVRFGRLKQKCITDIEGPWTPIQRLWTLMASQFAFLVDIFAGDSPILNGLFGVDFYERGEKKGLRVVFPDVAAHLPVHRDQCAGLRATVI